jgi:tRNA modification GTPase
VHEEEGTTRDVIKEHVEINGLDFIFHDTAGLRDIDSGPEAIGIARSIDVIDKSDLLLYVIDATKGMSEEDLKWLMSGKRVIAVLNKIDLTLKIPLIPDGIESVRISAKYSNGIDNLFTAMRAQFASGLPIVFIKRHIVMLKKATENMKAFICAIENGLSMDAAIMDVKQASICLDTILGKDVDDDILDDVFSRFCVGK